VLTAVPCLLTPEHEVEANVSLYSVGEYSLYNVLVNLGTSYTVLEALYSP
jgi:hypothetical protein